MLPAWGSTARGQAAASHPRVPPRLLGRTIHGYDMVCCCAPAAAAVRGVLAAAWAIEPAVAARAAVASVVVAAAGHAADQLLSPGSLPLGLRGTTAHSRSKTQQGGLAVSTSYKQQHAAALLLLAAVLRLEAAWSLFVARGTVKTPCACLWTAT